MPDEGSPGHLALDSPPTSYTSDSPSAQTNSNGSNHDHDGQPRTPPNPKRPRPPHQQHSRTPSLPSPLAMSLHHLGIGTPSPLLRQFSTFSSPPTWGSPPLGMALAGKDDHHEALSLALSGPVREVDSDIDIMQDSKDDLVQRLGDLIQQLRGPGSIPNLEELHEKVDEMEAVLGGGRGARPSLMGPDKGFKDHISFQKMPPPLPVRPGGEVATSTKVLGKPEQVVSMAAAPGKALAPDVTAEVAVEAEKLNAELVKLAERLRARKEESDHIQAMLVERAEAAAAHILELETYIAELEDEIGCNESDLRHLRIELRAIQTLCHEFVPLDADPELTQSIENWKSDWAMLREKMSSKKKSRCKRQGGEEEGDSTILTPSISGMSTLGSPLK